MTDSRKGKPENRTFVVVQLFTDRAAPGTKCKIRSGVGYQAYARCSVKSVRGTRESGLCSARSFLCNLCNFTRHRLRVFL